MNRWILFLYSILVVGMTGCSKELTAGGFREGEVETAVTDDGDSPSSVRYNRSVAGPSSASPATSGALLVRLHASLIDAAGIVTPLTNDTVEAELPLESSQRIQVGLTTLEAKRYTVVRVTIPSLEAQVQGLLIGGVSFSGEVTVDLGGPPLVVDVPVDLVVREDERSQVTIDLNSTAWLASADLVPGSLPPSARVQRDALREAIRVTTE